MEGDPGEALSQGRGRHGRHNNPNGEPGEQEALSGIQANATTDLSLQPSSINNNDKLITETSNSSQSSGDTKGEFGTCREQTYEDGIFLRSSSHCINKMILRTFD